MTKKLNESHACAFCGERSIGGVFNQGRKFCNWFCKDWFTQFGEMTECDFIRVGES